MNHEFEPREWPKRMINEFDPREWPAKMTHETHMIQVI